MQIDVTYENLQSLKDVQALQPALEFLKDFWCGSNKERESNVRLGTIDVFIDEQGNLHLDFISRFSLEKYPELIEHLRSVGVPQYFYPTKEV